MIEFLKILTKILGVIPVALLLFDLIYSWINDAQMYIRGTGEALTEFFPGFEDSGFAQSFRLTFSQEAWDFIMNTPLAIMLCFIPILTWMIYRTMEAVAHKRMGGRIDKRKDKKGSLKFKRAREKSDKKK